MLAIAFLLALGPGGACSMAAAQAAADSRAPGPGPRFEEIALEAGLTGRNTSGLADQKYLIESIGQGAGFLDYDGDGDQDLFVANGSFLPGRRGKGSPHDFLYRNEGGGRFSEVSRQAGVASERFAFGVGVADVDADGFPDLYVTNWGPNLLWHNRGDGTFEERAAAAGVAGRGEDFSTGVAVGDPDADGDPDLYVTNYIRHHAGLVHTTEKPCLFLEFIVSCGPIGTDPQPDHYWRNDGTGRFQDATREAGLAGVAPSYGLQPLFIDLDGDGSQDLFVANDAVANFFFANDGKGRFEELGMESGLALDRQARAQSCMGVAPGDVNGDGLADLFVTNFSHEYHTLYVSEGGGFFRDDTTAEGLAGPTFADLSWGAVFLDAANDTRPELLYASGHIHPQMDTPGTETSYAQELSLFEQAPSGRWSEISSLAGPAFAGRRWVSRGLAVGDVDDDGLLDGVVVNLNDRLLLLHNITPGGGAWVKLRVLGPGGQDALGARVEIHTGVGRDAWQEVVRGGSYLSSHDPRLHFGLGTLPRKKGGEEIIPEIRVRWPGGARTAFRNLAPRRLWILREDSAGGPVARLLPGTPGGTPAGGGAKAAAGEEATRAGDARGAPAAAPGEGSP